MTTTATAANPRHTHRRPRSLATSLAAVLATVLLAGCGAAPADREAAPSVPPVPAEPTPEPAPETPTPEPEDTPEASEPLGPATVVRASADVDVDVYPAPDAAEPIHTLPATTEFGSPLTLLVTTVGDGEQSGWLEVALPIRPNGSTGWVRAAGLETRTVEVAVDVDLDARELHVREDGEVVLTTTVAIGDPDHPTPTGTFFVTDKLDTEDPSGPYGPYAIGLSGRSDVLTEFAGGDGQVGIHGTNQPDLIGEAVSHGCVRVPNDVIEQLVRLLPLGTPVTVS